ncbi:MAG: molybdopterin-dependent oxidoreductase [bacterium]|nr:molybdopterin-dependent oxidoreductase [bacterium]
MEKEKLLRSVCPFDCPDTCGLLVTVENGRAVKVTGDPEHPVTRGLLCPKMQHYEDTVHSSRRLTTPLMRVGIKGTGEFAPISWQAAIKHICTAWKALIAEHGAECILPYSYAGTMGLVQRNAGHPFFHTLGASRLDRTICSPAKGAGWNMIMGSTPAMDPAEIEDSDLIILWGINAAATSIHTMRDALAAKQRGARLWVIDTWTSRTADTAGESFVVKPGTDGALALGMMHVLVRDRLCDQPFIQANVLGFEEFSGTVLPDCSPENMAAVCGLDAATIERMAHIYAAAKAPFIRLGSGLTRYANGAMTVRTITCLPAFIGAWQKKGGGLLSATSTGAAFPQHLVTREDFIKNPTRLVNMNQLGAALNTLDSPPIKSLYVYHSNPAAVTPDQNAVIRGLMREDLFTVVHERFLTDTARYADIVLPATSSLEHADIYRSYGNYVAQYCEAVIAPLGEAKSNWDVFCLLAKGMGMEDPFFDQPASVLIDQLLAENNAWRDEAMNAALRAGEPVRLRVPGKAKRVWQTPSGRIEILNKHLDEVLPRLLPTHAAQDGYPLSLQSAPTPYALNSSFYEQDRLRVRQGQMQLLIHAEDAAARRLYDGQEVLVFNQVGEVQCTLRVSERTRPGTVVCEGVWWTEFVAGKCGINALTSQRLTDSGRGSTLYDVSVDVQAANQPV